MTVGIFCLKALQYMGYYQTRKLVQEPGGSLLNQRDGGPTLKLLPRAVQQLKLLPRVDTTSHF